MKGIILAAGLGSRMRHLTQDTPKCLIKLQGKTLLEWQLKTFNKAGIKEIAIVTGYKKELFYDFNLTQFHNENYASTNMVTSLVHASQWLESHECIVSYSDIFYHHSVIANLKNSGKNIAISYDVNWQDLWQKRFHNPLVDAETFKIDTKSYLIDIGRKTNIIDEIQGQYMGVLFFKPDGWSEFYKASIRKKDFKKIYITDVLQDLIQNNIKIKAVPYDLPWGELDTENDFKLYNNELKLWEKLI